MFVVGDKYELWVDTRRKSASTAVQHSNINLEINEQNATSPCFPEPYTPNPNPTHYHLGPIDGSTRPCNDLHHKIRYF